MSKSKALILKITIPIAILLVFLAAALFTGIILKGKNKYGRIDTSRDTEEQVFSDWHYNGVKYSVAPGLSLWNTPYEECTEENGFFLISIEKLTLFYNVKIFGDNAENPHYLYCPYQGIKSQVHVSEDFDYMDEEYILYREDSQGERIQTDTEFSFKLKDVYYPDKPIESSFDTEPIGYFDSYSKSFERLEFLGDILLVNNEYYVDLNHYGISGLEYTYKAKPEFIELLKEAGILS